MKSRLLPNGGISVANVSGNYSKVESDEIGNITSYDGLNYTWVGRQLKSVSQVGNPSVGATYSYNSDGQRIGKNIILPDGETYDYDYYYNGDILAGYKLVITKSDGLSTTHNVAFMYDENGEAFGFNYNGNDYYYVRNAQNDVIFISNSDNTGVVMYQYDAWGNMTACYDTSDDGMLSIVNPYTYRGYFYEFETNTYFLKSRYYNPELCRFISADSVDVLDEDQDNVLENNLFAYCLNNPINMVDDDGELAKSTLNLIKIGIGALAIGIGVTATIISGGAAIPVLVASIKMAATSAAFGAMTGAGTVAIKHRRSTGSWKGGSQAIISGAIDGAADGFMWGGISAGATFTTLAAKGIKVKQIGKLKPANKKGNGYRGIKYKNQRGSVKSFELHSPHKKGPHQKWHWQQNTWNPQTGGVTGRSIRWTLFGRRF